MKSLIFTTLALTTALVAAQQPQQPYPFNNQNQNQNNQNQGIGFGAAPGFPGSSGFPGAPGGVGGFPGAPGGMGGGAAPWGATLLQSLENKLRLLIENFVGNVQRTPGLDRNQFAELFNSLKDKQNLTKTQVQTIVEEWVAKQGAQLQTVYKDAVANITAEMKNMTAQLDAKAATLSPAAQTAYQQYKVGGGDPGPQ